VFHGKTLGPSLAYRDMEKQTFLLYL